MTKRMFASPLYLAIATAALLAAPALAQTAAAPATPAAPMPAAATPAAPAPAAAAPAASAPAAAAPSAAMPAMKMKPTAAARTQRVEKLQTALNANGASLPVDGKMGPKTHAALMDFQKAKGLKATGRVDKETMAALMKPAS
jgi:peptidoglycan hydrolase-like protein with peptidoglycan-binding domain